MARLRFTDRYPSSDPRKSSVNRLLREIIKTGLEGPDKAKYQLRGGPNQSIEVGQTGVSNSHRCENVLGTRNREVPDDALLRTEPRDDRS